MAIVGFEFNKIEAHKKKGGKLDKINLNVKIANVAQEDLNFGGSSQATVRFEFETTADYGPIGQVLLKGSILYMAPEADAKAVVAEWKKDKKIKKPLMAAVYNKILGKSTLMAMQLSDSVGLPPPIQMPRVSVEKKA